VKRRGVALGLGMPKALFAMRKLKSVMAESGGHDAAD
jgi:hypothetical protein